MATTSKQYKAIGEDLWKGRTEKIVCMSHSADPNDHPDVLRDRMQNYLP